MLKSSTNAVCVKKVKHAIDDDGDGAVDDDDNDDGTCPSSCSVFWISDCWRVLRVFLCGGTSEKIGESSGWISQDAKVLFYRPFVKTEGSVGNTTPGCIMLDNPEGARAFRQLCCFQFVFLLAGQSLGCRFAFSGHSTGDMHSFDIFRTLRYAG